MTQFPRYATGTISIAIDGTVATGVGTIFTGANVRPGDLLIAGGHMTLIDDVTDVAHLIIPPWKGGALTAAPYVVFQTSPKRFANADAMEAVTRMLAVITAEGFYVFVRSDQSAPDSAAGYEGQYARKSSTGEEWLKTGGAWVSQGISGAFKFDDADWSAATNYAQRVIVTRAGKLWLSLQGGNLNHVPESSPAWWKLFLKGGDAYDIPISDTDMPAAGEEFFFTFTRTVSFYAGLSDSRARAKIGASANAVYSFRKGSTQFATLTFAAGGQGGPQTGVFAAAADTIFNAGDVMTIIAPASRDASLYAVAFTLSGYRN